MGRVVGVDLGSKRIGFAVSDPDRIIATAHKVVECAGDRKIREAILAVCAETGADLLVLGLPLNMDGSSGPAAERAQKFQADMRELLSIPIILWDERLTTKSAHAVLIEAGARRSKRRDLVDKVAAQFMLQHFLDAQPA
jgi:putative Holliday junction resolvase